VTPQIANHYSVTQGQVNNLQTFSVQQMRISMQQVYSVIQYNAITLSDSKEHYYYKLQFDAYSYFQV